MKAVLIGDSIRMGYFPLVAEKCKKKEVDVWAPGENCRHSLWVVEHFQEWVADQMPDIVHFNFGLHDSLIREGDHQILLEQYRLCLKRFIVKVKRLGNTKMIWATTTPLYEPEDGVPMAQWQFRPEREIAKYNATALEVVRDEGLAVNDLHELILRNDFSKCLTEGGCHMTDFGNEILSDAVVEAITSERDAPSQL